MGREKKTPSRDYKRVKVEDLGPQVYEVTSTKYRYVGPGFVVENRPCDRRFQSLSFQMELSVTGSSIVLHLKLFLVFPCCHKGHIGRRVLYDISRG